MQKYKQFKLFSVILFKYLLLLVYNNMQIRSFFFKKKGENSIDEVFFKKMIVVIEISCIEYSIVFNVIKHLLKSLFKISIALKNLFC